MHVQKNLKAGIVAVAAISCLFLSAPAGAATFVYVSNNEDGNIGMYTLQPDGSLQPGARVPPAGKVVMPMSVSPDKRFLVAAVRSKPFLAQSYSIDRATGALKSVGTGPLHESFPYIFFDRSGRFLLGASYGAHLVSVNPVGADGRVGEPMQVIPTARNAHAIITDNTNRFVYLLNELTATVTTLALDGKTGLLTELSSASALPPDSKLGPGAPRPSPGRDVSNDIWASDLHLTPNGRFLYAAERTSSSLGAFGVDAASGKLSYLGSTPTEKQPRGFRIDPTGRFMVVSGEKSDTISVYAIDPASGALRLLNKVPTGKGSNWVEIVSFD